MSQVILIQWTKIDQFSLVVNDLNKLNLKYKLYISLNSLIDNFKSDNGN